MTRIRLWTLIGESGTGKSRSIKTLLSREDGGPPGFRDVLLRSGGYLSVIGKVMAWQEAGKSPDESVDEIKRWVQSCSQRRHGAPAFVNVLSALRFDPVTKPNGSQYPSGKDYLERWIMERWIIESIVLMSPDPDGAHDFYGGFGAPTFWHYGSRNQSAGNMVGFIRNHFGWA